MLHRPEASDTLVIAGREFRSRLFLGTAGYPNRLVMLDAVSASGDRLRRSAAALRAQIACPPPSLSRRLTMSSTVGAEKQRAMAGSCSARDASFGV